MKTLVLALTIFTMGYPSFAQESCADLFSSRNEELLKNLKLTNELFSKNTKLESEAESFQLKIQTLYDRSQSIDEFVKLRNDMPVPEQRELFEHVLLQLQETASNLRRELRNAQISSYKKIFPQNTAEELRSILNKLDMHIGYGKKLLNQGLRYRDLQLYFFQSSYYLPFQRSSFTSFEDFNNVSDLKTAAKMIRQFGDNKEDYGNYEKFELRMKFIRRLVQQKINKDHDDIVDDWQIFHAVMTSPWIHIFNHWNFVGIGTLNEQKALGLTVSTITNKDKLYDDWKTPHAPSRILKHDYEHALQLMGFLSKALDYPSFDEQKAVYRKMISALKKLDTAIENTQDLQVRAYLEIIFYEITHENANLIFSPRTSKHLLVALTEGKKPLFRFSLYKDISQETAKKLKSLGLDFDQQDFDNMIKIIIDLVSATQNDLHLHQ